MSTNETQEQVETTAKSTSSCSKMPVLILTMAIVALIAVAYNSQLTFQLKNTLATENTLLQSEIAQLKQQQQELKAQSDSAKETIEQSKNDLSQKLTSINGQLKAANAKTTQEQSWQLQQARYYLELAQINSHWNQTNQPTLELLQQANNMLGHVNLPEIFNIRQIIAKEITQLNAIKPLDFSGILSQLDAIQASLYTLRIQQPAMTSEETDPNSPSLQESPPGWKTHFQDSLLKLKTLVVIRRTDEDIKPLMTPLLETLMKESISLNLQEAQWALLNKNQDIYQWALTHAITQIKKAFNQDAQNIATLLQQLTTLQKLDLTPATQSVGEALPLLNQLIDQSQSPNPVLNQNKSGDQNP
jgi:uroporphyrin-3 C-methyltransferase